MTHAGLTATVECSTIRSVPTPTHEYPPLAQAGGDRGKLGSLPLRDMFAAVPAHYDLINRLVTWGFDERWRRRAAGECLRHSPKRVLDLCCGTGDLALHLAMLAEKDVEIVGLDFCEPMLKVAKAKAIARDPERKVSFIQGDAADMPFANGHFAALGISFAFRNITYRNPLRPRHLAEMLRVLAPGGRCVILETSQPDDGLLRAAYHLYLKAVVSLVGAYLSGHHGAYRYLAESARRFYRPKEVRHLLMEAGFREVETTPLLFGVAALHVATR